MASRGPRSQGGSKRADRRPTTPLDGVAGYSSPSRGAYGRTDSYPEQPQRSRSAIGHQTSSSYLDVPVNYGSGRLSREGSRETLRPHPQPRSRSRSPIPSAAVAHHRTHTTSRDPEHPDALSGPSKRFLASPARVERHGQSFDSSDSDSSLSYPNEPRERLPTAGRASSPYQIPGSRNGYDTRGKIGPTTETEAKSRISPTLLNKAPTKLPRPTKHQQAPETPLQPRRDTSPSVRPPHGFIDGPVHHHLYQPLSSVSSSVPHAAMMLSSSATSGTTKEWSRYEAVHGSSRPSADNYSVAPSEFNNRNIPDLQDANFEDSDIPYHIHHPKGNPEDDLGRREIKIPGTGTGRKRVQAPVKRRSPSPPPIPVPPPSPADARKPNRQRSSTHLKAPKENPVPEVRPRSKSTSESVQPLARPSAKLRSTENLGLGNPPPRSALTSKTLAKPTSHE